jgi:hypothetical protein
MIGFLPSYAIYLALLALLMVSSHLQVRTMINYHFMIDVHIWKLHVLVMWHVVYKLATMNIVK